MTGHRGRDAATAPPFDAAALAVAGAWAVGVSAVAVWTDAFAWSDAPVIVLAASVPPCLVWLAVRLERLRRSLARPHHGGATKEESAIIARLESAAARLEERITRLGEEQAKTDRRLAEIARLLRSRRPAEVAASPEPPAPTPDSAPAHRDQKVLEFPAVEVTDAPGLGLGAFIEALQFPADTDDAAGFRALRRALRDPGARQLVTSAQDVLTLLSQDGLFMDDLVREAPDPGIWRRFAGGERGQAMVAMGGIRDADALDAVAARARRDPIFRDAVHHFLRHFDHALAALAPTATDADLLRLSETRTARAFMLLGRAARMFD